MSSQVNYWKELSEYDLETAEAMLKSKRYLYVGFMAHQAIEKILKSYFVKIHADTPPYSHSLSYIAKKAELYELLSEKQQDFIDLLEPMNIECRYPVHKEELLKTLTDEKCIEILKDTRELQIWIKQRL
ncbi:MAG: HEPN domain-containing protein [Desulfatiglans sp.]|jgi:HEPN domain-containing protein|nr:HEPN domain-containing protein [Desulfatiglans sp.]